MRKPFTVELSLRPYSGRLFVASTRAEYERAHKRIFKNTDELTCEYGGRFSGGCDKSGYWAYLVWASDEAYLAHEFSHVIFHVFERCGLNPMDSAGEAFCYLLSQLMHDAKDARKRRR